MGASAGSGDLPVGATGDDGILDSVNDELNAIPPGRRRRMALALAPLGLVLLVTGALAASLGGLGWKLAGLFVAALSLVLLGVAWGLRRSAVLSEAAAAEQRLDEVLTAAVRSQGAACHAGEDGTGSGRAGFRRTDPRGADSSFCGALGGACGSSSAPGGCGAACVARAAPPVERGSVSRHG